jgi:hypothetical protein
MIAINEDKSKEGSDEMEEVKVGSRGPTKALDSRE